MSDPTKVRNQPALTTSTGKEWLIVGGLFAAIAVALLVALTALDSRALTAAIAVAALYAAMIATHLVAKRHKLRLLAAEMLLMAAIALAATLIVAATP